MACREKKGREMTETFFIALCDMPEPYSFFFSDLKNFFFHLTSSKRQRMEQSMTEHLKRLFI